MGLVAREGSDTIFSADTMTTGVKQSHNPNKNNFISKGWIAIAGLKPLLKLE